jgi:hypothetical protein
LFHEHVVRLCGEAGVVGEGAVWAGDSTPMWCYGALLDTVRLLGDGLRMLARQWARATRCSLEDVAKDWGLPWMLAKSTKGGLDVDWRDADARTDAVHQLAEAVVAAVTLVSTQHKRARKGLRKSCLRFARRLARVVKSDLEADEKGRLVIARRTAEDRLVSLTDPQARSGRKSKRQVFKGFKVHLVGDVVSGLIAAISVTSGNTHDGRPAHRLIRRAKNLFDSIERVLADTAYGGSELHRKVRRTLGVELLAPPPKGGHPKDEFRFRKQDFEVDLDEEAAVCPAGLLTNNLRATKSAVYFTWSKKDCSPCPLRQQCFGKGDRRRLTLHRRERELRRRRAEWDKPETRAAYRVRSQCERLVAQVVRHGGRQARAWGLAAANLQAHAIAAACNLALLAKALSSEDDP